MHKHTRQIGFDSLEGRQLLSVTPTALTPVAAPAPLTHSALLADIQLDLTNLAKQQGVLKKDMALVTRITNNLGLENRQLTLAQSTFTADETALLDNLQLPPTKAVLAARQADFDAVSADVKIIGGLNKDITRNTTNLTVAQTAETKDAAIVTAIRVDVAADIQALAPEDRFPAGCLPRHQFLGLVAGFFHAVSVCAVTCLRRRSAISKRAQLARAILLPMAPVPISGTLF